MNWLLIIVLVILAFSVWNGYRKGFIRVLFSLVSLIVTLVLATVATPYVVTYIEEQTTIDDKITEKCLIHVEEKAQQKLEDESQQQTQQAQEEAEKSGVDIPAEWLEKIVGEGSRQVGQALEESGIYQEMAQKLSHFIVCGATFFLLLILISLVLHLLIHMLDLVAKLPGIKQVNHLLGMIMGLIKGILFIWLLMYLLSIFATGPFGLMMMDYIQKSRFLSFLYQYNLLLDILIQIF